MLYDGGSVSEKEQKGGAMKNEKMDSLSLWRTKAEVVLKAAHAITNRNKILYTSFKSTK